jgi:hypothetical protein
VGVPVTVGAGVVSEPVVVVAVGVTVGMTDGLVGVGVTEPVPVVVGNGVSVVVAVGAPVGMTDGSVGTGVTEPVADTVALVVVPVAVGVAAVSVVAEGAPETSGTAMVVVCEKLITVEVGASVPTALACAIASARLSNVVTLVILTVDSLTVVAGSGSRFT